MSKPRIRCAIYTRKSSDEGLDQAFNSLDAQHEACAAYIASQRHEGWVAAKTRFDDGGLSGGTLDRPALQRLLAEIAAGHIQMVVVYKIDRLTRSLADFAKLVERLDAADCSFVSVTQAFNTASSMGRLTLNVLLSFAQFEREVTAERIRDKIAASKKKGLWMGGLPPLGYDPHPDPKIRGLIVNSEEARVVRNLFMIYEELGCLNAVMKSATEKGLRSKLHQFKSGRHQGGGPFSRGQIYAVLRNPIYIGKIRHKSQLFDGQHEPIIDEAIWDSVQSKLQTASARPRRRKDDPVASRSRWAAPLTGKMHDETGDRLTPTHTKRYGRQIRYYVSNRLISGGKDARGWRLPATALEQAITRAIARHLTDLSITHRICREPDLTQADRVSTRVQMIANALDKEAADPLRAILASGRIEDRRLILSLNSFELAAALELPIQDIAPEVLTINVPFALRRRGVEGKIVTGEALPSPDHTILRALKSAHAWASDVRCGIPLHEIAAKSGRSASYIRTRTQLAFLSPRIQIALLEGLQPPDLTLEQIIRRPVPLDWSRQEEIYGFNAVAISP